MPTRQTIKLWVAQDGDDKQPGTQQKPVKTPHRALALLRQIRKAAKEPISGEILFAGGLHFLKRPLVLDHRDSGATFIDPWLQPVDPTVRTILRSVPGERACLSGGKLVTGIKMTTVNGVSAWVAKLPAVQRGNWWFTQLWVNGKRAKRSRFPEQGEYRIEKRLTDNATTGLHEQAGVFVGDEGFIYAEGDAEKFHNLSDVEFVGLHFWIESRIPLASIDTDKRRIDLAGRTRMNLTDNHKEVPAPYYFDHVKEALSNPGEWYLDRVTGELFYIPRPGETIEETQMIAANLESVVELRGDIQKDRGISLVELQDLTFSHNEYREDIDVVQRSVPQSACHVGGAIVLHGADKCCIDNCMVEHVGSYGIEVSGGSSGCAIRNTTVTDVAAGGIKIFQDQVGVRAGESAPPELADSPWLRCRRIEVSDCHIFDGGYRWRQGAGLLIGNCPGNKLIHNHIHDFDYSGISLGWTWGYQESYSGGSIIEWNHIHDIGRGVLSDMGGIYTLGHQPGTRIRYNHIHDVNSRGYGGWGIYPDEGSSDILIESNLVHDTGSGSFHLHFGCNNVVRNNIFSFSGDYCLRIGIHEYHRSLTMENNIVIADHPRVLSGNGYDEPIPLDAVIDNNIYWCTTGKAVRFKDMSLTQWRKLGFDKHSKVVDPGFINAAKRNFCLKKNSPALKMGFIGFDITRTGVRKREKSTRHNH